MIAADAAVTGSSPSPGITVTAEELLARGEAVRTLSRRPEPTHPLNARVDFGLLQFDEAALTDELRGASTLYNTYWVRFPRGDVTWNTVLEDTRTLLRAARAAGVERVVHFPASRTRRRTHPFRTSGRRRSRSRTSAAPARVRHPPSDLDRWPGRRPPEQHRLGAAPVAALRDRRRRRLPRAAGGGDGRRADRGRVGAGRARSDVRRRRARATDVRVTPSAPSGPPSERGPASSTSPSRSRAHSREQPVARSAMSW